MLPSPSRNFGWEQAKSSDYFLLSFGRYADSEARPGITQKRSSLRGGVDDVGTQSPVSTFCKRWSKHTTHWSRRKRCSSASSRSAHLEIRSKTRALRADGSIRKTIAISIQRRNHEEAKGNVVDSSHRAGSGGSGIGCSIRLLCIRRLLCFLFW
jgi:hypothetical protein